MEERQVEAASEAMPNRFVLEHLVLASASPRRAEILRSVGWSFETSPADIDESIKKGESPADHVQRLAREKAERVAQSRTEGLVLGADTIVVIDGDRILGKPRDASEAQGMLKALRGRAHDVLTGVALVRVGTKEIVVSHERTRVTLAAMTDDEIGWYVTTEEPMDKAGAYAAQAVARRSSLRESREITGT
ncbi:MAG: Maf family protein [Pyrinomonadaceae bacterium]